MRVRTRLLLSVVTLAVVAAALSAAPAVASAKHNARLLQVGNKGLYSYNAWTGKRTLLIKGMGVHGMAREAPFFSPGKKSIATVGCNRSDRAYDSYVRIARYPRGKVYKFGNGTMCGFEGWIDSYHALIWTDDGKFSVDSRTGARARVSDSTRLAVPSRRKTTGDKRYKVTVSKNRATVRVRSTGHKVSSFKVPGSGGVWRMSTYGSDWSVSPDGKYVAFELSAMPYNDARVEWSVWVSTIKGKHAKKMRFNTGGFVWR